MLVTAFAWAILEHKCIETILELVLRLKALAFSQAVSSFLPFLLANRQHTTKALPLL